MFCLREVKAEEKDSTQPRSRGIRDLPLPSVGDEPEPEEGDKLPTKEEILKLRRPKYVLFLVDWFLNILYVNEIHVYIGPFIYALFCHYLTRWLAEIETYQYCWNCINFIQVLRKAIEVYISLKNCNT